MRRWLVLLVFGVGCASAAWPAEACDGSDRVGYGGKLGKTLQLDYVVGDGCTHIAANTLLLPLGKKWEGEKTRQAHADEYDMTLLDGLGFVYDDCEEVVLGHPDRHEGSDMPHAHSYCLVPAVPGEVYTLVVTRLKGQPNRHVTISIVGNAP